MTFSSNDEHLISGSGGNKVVICDVHSGVLVVGLFYFHPRYFCTVLVMIDSRYIIAGTGDDTVQVWDVELKKVIGEPFQGHKNLDLSTACSFLCDGTHTTLCSGDKLG